MYEVAYELLISAIAFLLSILIDINWLPFRAFLPAKVLGFLRLIQGISFFTLTYLAALFLLEIYIQSYIFRLIIACFIAIFSSVMVGLLVVKRGAKARLEEVIKEKDLIIKIRESINETVSETAYNISREVRESIANMHSSIREKMNEIYMNLTLRQREIEKLLQGISTTLPQLNSMLNRYNEIIKLYQEEIQKYELLSLRVEEVTRLQEEYTRKIRELEKAGEDELKEEKVKLTKANGRASRALGNKAQHETANILRNMGFEVEEYYGVGQPDIILWWEGERVAVVAHKAYTFSEKIRQRTISKEDIRTELNVALKLKLPLVIIVTNSSNGRRYAEVIPYEKLGEFERFTTPLILVDDKPEMRRICEETLLKLKEILTRRPPKKT